MSVSLGSMTVTCTHIVQTQLVLIIAPVYMAILEMDFKITAVREVIYVFF